MTLKIPTHWRGALFDRVNWIVRAYKVALFLVFLALGLKEHHIIHIWLVWVEQSIGALPSPGTWDDMLLAALMAYIVSKALERFNSFVFSANLAVILRRSLLPINLALTDEKLKRITRYLDAAAALMRKEITQDDLKTMPSDDRRSPLLITLRGRSIASFADSANLPEHLEDGVDAVDCGYLLNPSQTVPPLVLQGDPGAGKSTLMFELFRRSRYRLEKSGHGWIPLVVFVRHLSLQMVQSCFSMEHLLIRYFEDLGSDIPGRKGAVGFAEMADFLGSSYDDPNTRFLIIFDGLDEFRDRRAYEKMAASLDRLVDPRPDDERKKGFGTFDGKNRYIVSCRTEDNQKKILGNLVTLDPPTWEHVMEYLKACRRRCNTVQKAKRIGGVIHGLKVSKENGLLRNYISNPYLLSLIVNYYEYPQTELAKTLENVFDDVVKRELAKVSTQSPNLAYYVVRLLSPYAYVRVASALAGSDEEVDFLQALRSEPELSTILFGDGQVPGYLEAVFSHNVNREIELQGELGDMWGKDEARTFRTILMESVNASTSLAEFEARAAAGIKKHLFSLLQDSNLAVLTEDGQGIDHFRHRRLQDYFVALYIDHVGIQRCVAVRQQLANAWLREPLRIYAAIGRTPEDLLAECTSHLDGIIGDTSVEPFERLNRASNLLLNASSAVAYLPCPRKEPAQQALTDAVLALGKRVHDIYHLVLSPQTTVATGSEGDLLPRKCLECFRNIYASEFLSTQTTQHISDIFATSYQTAGKRKLNSWVVIYRRTLKEGESYQQLSYKFLYPIRDLHADFPISRFLLFLYIIDVVLLFRYKYVELIWTTHTRRWSRIPTFFIAWSVRISIGVLLFLVLWAAGLIPGVVLVLVILAFLQYMAKFFIQQGYIGDPREVTVVLPWWILAQTKRAFARGLRVPDLQIDRLPFATLASTQDASSQHLELIDSLRPTDVAKDKPGAALGATGHPHSRFREHLRLATWPGVVASCFVLVLVLSPLVLRASQFTIHAYRVFNLTTQTSQCEKEVSRLTAESDRSNSSGSERLQLEDLNSRITAENNQVDSLLSTADALTTDTPTSLTHTYLSRTTARLTSARGRVRTLESRVATFLAQIDNSSEWNSLTKSIENLRSNMASLQDPTPAASAEEINAILQDDEHVQSQLRSLRVTVTSFHDRLLRGGLQPDVAPVVQVIESLNKIAEERQTRLLAYLSSAQLREAAASFFNQVPALLSDIRAGDHVRLENANLQFLRSEADATNQLWNRLQDLLRQAQWLKAQSITVTARDALEEDTKKLDAVTDALSERVALLQRRLNTAEVMDAVPKFAGAVDKLTSDVRQIKTTRFENPDEALTAIDELRRRLDQVVRDGTALKDRVEDKTLSDELDNQILRLNKDLGELEIQTTNWTARLDAEQKRTAVSALRGRIQEVLANIPESAEEARALIREIDSIQGKWERLGRPTELLSEVRKMTVFRKEVERKQRTWQEATSTQSHGVQARKDSLLEARCASLAQNYGLDETKVKDVEVFISQDAPALTNAVDRVVSGPRIVDLLITYGRIHQHLSRLRQVESSLQFLKGATSLFLSEARDIQGNSAISEKCRAALEPLVKSAQDIDTRTTATEQLAQRLQATDFEQTLLKDESEAKQMAWSSAVLMLAISILGVVAFRFFIMFSRRFDKKGLTELSACRTFEEQLCFIVSNGFSRSVNAKAISKLQVIMQSPPPGALRMLSDAAQAREKRGPGVLNGDIASQLRELARGLDNILNR